MFYIPSDKLPLWALLFKAMMATFQTQVPAAISTGGESGFLRKRNLIGLAFGFLAIAAAIAELALKLVRVLYAWLIAVTVFVVRLPRKWVVIAIVLMTPCICCMLTTSWLSSSLRSIGLGNSGLSNMQLTIMPASTALPMPTLAPDIVVITQKELTQSGLTFWTAFNIASGQGQDASGAIVDLHITADVRSFLDPTTYFDICKVTGDSGCVITNAALIEYAKAKGLSYLAGPQ